VLDAIQLTAKHKVATPVNWKRGDDVIILAFASDDEAKAQFPAGWKATEALSAPSFRSRDNAISTAPPIAPPETGWRGGAVYCTPRTLAVTNQHSAVSTARI